MELPSFLLRENRKPPSEEDIEFMRLMEEYKERFGDYPGNEPSSYTDAEWIKMLKKCLKKNITIEELWGVPYDPDALY
ncbi:MAG: hypothetical protein ACI4EJ_03735 [Bacteroides sp.]